MRTHVVWAIFRRNFLAYFSSPTGYVFMIAFVLLSGFAAFWTNEFWNANLANLNQLSRYLPYILLIYIPAITMGIWAEERRQGTDELLLTLPANDFEVVLGKYLAAVAIYTVSLSYSVLCNYLFLAYYGNPDMGLILANFVGYWLLGIAMLSVGIVASFLTGNLTVGFILGALFNAPLVFASSAETIFPPQMAVAVKSWSAAEQLTDFGRGVISLRGTIFFLSIVLLMLYASMILIGKRHWGGGRDGVSMGPHFFLRLVGFVALACGFVMFVARNDFRIDTSSERLSSLSEQTKNLLDTLDPEKPVRVEAFVSDVVPEQYIQSRLQLLSLLQELSASGRGKVQVTIHGTEPLSEEADLAEKSYGITPREVMEQSRGVIRRSEIFMGVAFSSGLKKVVIPFMERGIPPEYELTRSLCTVSEQKRKRIGVLITDAKLFGGFDPARGSMSRREPLIEELEKQYDVVQVSADSPIIEKYDALLAVQPSSLTQEQMVNFIDCVKQGQPTAIFEDPAVFLTSVPGTMEPKRQQGGMFGGSAPPGEKGDLAPLWQLLGVDFVGGKVIWQKFNPFPTTANVFEDEFVFIDYDRKGTGMEINENNDATSKLQRLLFLAPGTIAPKNNRGTNIVGLIATGNTTGTVDVMELHQPDMFGGQSNMFNPGRRKSPTGLNYMLAAQIRGKSLDENQEMADEQPDADAEASDDESADAKSTAGDEDVAKDDKPAGNKKAGKKQADEKKAGGKSSKSKSKGGAIAGKTASRLQIESAKVNVILVADVDCVLSEFFQLRARGIEEQAGAVNFDFDNPSFVLNIVDVLAKEDRFLDIRKRRRLHRSLDEVELLVDKARQDVTESNEQIVRDFEQERAALQKEMEEKLEKIRNRKDISDAEKESLLNELGETQQRKAQVRGQQAKQKFDREVKRQGIEFQTKINSIQDLAKTYAVILPLILPIMSGLFVYFNRRINEREGVARSRLR